MQAWLKRRMLRARRIMQQRVTNKDREGLTLVELAIVILVIGIILGIVVANIDFGVVGEAQKLQVKSQRTNLQSAMMRHEMDNSRLEDGAQLTSIVSNEDSALDPWGNPYFICRDENDKRQICSYGADGQEGGEAEESDFYLTGDKKDWPEWLQKNKGNEDEDEGG